MLILLFKDALAAMQAGQVTLPDLKIPTVLPPPTAHCLELAAIKTGDFETNRGLICGNWALPPAQGGACVRKMFPDFDLL
jgi:hypothetical protein